MLATAAGCGAGIISVVIGERHEQVLVLIGHGETAAHTDCGAEVEELIGAGLIRRDVEGLTLTVRGWAVLDRLLVE